MPQLDRKRETSYSNPGVEWKRLENPTVKGVNDYMAALARYVRDNRAFA